jgi:hypothetical protein
LPVHNVSSTTQIIHAARILSELSNPPPTRDAHSPNVIAGHGTIGVFHPGTFESCRGTSCFRSSSTLSAIPGSASVRLLVGAWSLSQ